MFCQLSAPRFLLTWNPTIESIPKLELFTRKFKFKQITSTWMTYWFLRKKLTFRLNFISIVGSHIRVNKRATITRVVRGVKIFEFEIWGWLKGRHLQTKRPYTLKFTTTTKCNINKSCTRTQWNHKSKQHNKQMHNARCRTTKTKKT